MKQNKRYCVECDAVTAIVTNDRDKFSAYHCRKCGAEIGRVGDGDVVRKTGAVRGGIDIKSLSSELIDGQPAGVVALNHPEILSDEHRMWPERDEEVEESRAEYLAAFKTALKCLTPRQREVVDTVDKCGSRVGAAATLNVAQSTITYVLQAAGRRIEKKIKELREEMYKKTADRGYKGGQQ